MTVKEQLQRMVELLPDEDARRMLDSLKSSNGEDFHDSGLPPIGQILEDLGREIPPGEWERLPSDLTDHLDGYLYGHRTE